MSVRLCMNTVTIAVVFAVGALSGDTVTAADRFTEVEGLIQEALASEAAGSQSLRDHLLKQAIEQDPQNAKVRWLMGYVKRGEEWVKIDDVSGLTEQNAKLTAYRVRRQRAPDTLQGHEELAAWCKANRLTEQQRAHLTRVLELNPDHVRARRELGFIRVNGVWMSRQEILNSRQQAQEAARAFAVWRPRFEAILRGLSKNSGKLRTQAAEQLKLVKEPAAIPAMERVLSSFSRPAALLTIDQLGNMRANEASVSLARHAVFSVWPDVRKQAARKLKSRDPHGYVPAMLASMYTPTQSRAELFRLPNGRVVYRQTLAREGQTERDVTVLDTVYRKRFWKVGVSELFNADVSAIQQSVEGNQQTAAAVAAQNRFTESLNGRICAVLNETTGQQLKATPENWWRWWNAHNEVYLEDEKPVERVYRQRERIVEVGSPERRPESPRVRTASEGSPPPARRECLAAGTLVWTEWGPNAVEDIKVGDRVLSQNPDTGELAYKPVLRPTKRPATRLLKLRVGDETWQTSGGHPYFVAGKGWVLARDLKAGMQLHAATGLAQIEKVEPGDHQRSFNLIVEDFHSYFVGQSRVLSHDNTIRQPTDAIVPGLLKR